MTPRANVLLVHGAWHAAWCWQPLAALLRDRGTSVTAIDLPGRGASTQPLGNFYADAAEVSRVLEAMDGPTIVVGHSYGGAVITQATAGHDNVACLVYLSAFMLDVGESMFGMAPEVIGDGTGLIARALRIDGSITSIDPELAPDLFYADCTPEIVTWAIAQLGPQFESGKPEPIAEAGWHEHPSCYAAATDDRAIPPDLQRRMATRATRTIEWPTSHSAFLSEPERLADLLTGEGLPLLE